MHEQPVFQKMGFFKNESYPHAEKTARNGFYIPAGLGISDAEIDIILVGDSLGNVIQGHKNTIPVTVADICYHTKIVSKGTTSPMIIADMPFQSYATLDKALENASALMQSGAEMVKIEGGKWTANIASELATRGIPICCHLGLTPQYIHKIGSYSVQGREEEIAKDIIKESNL